MKSHQVKIANIIRGLRPAPLGNVLKNIFFRNRFSFNSKYGTFFINPCENFGNTLMNEGVYEESLSKFIDHFSKESQTFFDIGANEGYFSILSKKSNPNIEVYSFEPQKRLISIIEKNSELNNLQLKINNIALSNTTSESYINLASTMNSGASSLNRKPSILSLKRQKINTVTLDDFIKSNDIKSIDLAKIDIEGHEYELVKGAKKTIESGLIKILFIDFHSTILSQDQIKEIKNFLVSNNYKTHRLFGIEYFSLL